MNARIALLMVLPLLASGCGSESNSATETDSGTSVVDTGGADVGAGDDTAASADASEENDTEADDTTSPDDTAVSDAEPSDTGSESDTSGAGTEIPCEIKTILDAHCTSCHGTEPLFGAPMSLVTLADLVAPSVSQAGKSALELSLERVVDDRSPMPPAPGERLTEEQIATLSAWLEAGSPAGTACIDDADVVDSDSGSGATDAGASDAGTPDDVGGDVATDTSADIAPDVPVEAACEWEVEFLANSGGGVDDTTPFTVPRSANHYECFYFAPTWDADAHGLRFESIIDDERVVHHWLLYAEAGSGTPGTRRGCSGSHENATLIAGWAPGGDDWIMPEGVGMQMPADTTYFVEIHYANPRNLNTTDRSGVRVCGTNTLRENTAGTHWLGTETILLLGSGSHETSGVCTPTLTEPAHILRSWPHMHRYGAGMFSEIIRAGGGREVMLDVPFSFDNQISYETEFTIYPGDRITTTCEFRTDTPFVTFGPDTEQEMCYNFVVAWPVGAFNTGGGIRGGSDNFCLR